MGGADRQGPHTWITPLQSRGVLLTFWVTGGKAKPLKAAKKANKELDEDDLAFQEKKRAGTTTTFPGPPLLPYQTPERPQLLTR